MALAEEVEEVETTTSPLLPKVRVGLLQSPHLLVLRQWVEGGTSRK